MGLTALAVHEIKQLSQAPDPNDSTTRTFIVSRGDGIIVVGRKLKTEGLIQNDLVFRLYVQNAAGQIEAGEYELSRNLSVKEIIEKLLLGPQDVWVTIPEGLRKEEVAQLIANKLDFASSTFDLQEFINLTSLPQNLEGKLFPDTYLIPKEASAGAVVRRLTTTFETKAKKIFTDRTNAQSEDETLRIAALVEREVRDENDRKIVAGIILKRLNAGWGLEIDATLQYARASSECINGGNIIKDDCKWWSPALSQDKQLESPFNTYKYRGLPPSPICNPGLSAIEAAAHPQASEYWFYLSDNEGVTHFARTLEEHQTNINKYLR